MRMVIIAGLTASLLVGVPAPASASPVEITREVSIPAAPASNFAGAAGGDGLNAIPYSGRVYSVFHHKEFFRVTCLQQSDGSACPSIGGNSWPITFTTDNAGVKLGSPMLSYGFINPSGTKLYAYAMQLNSSNANLNGGVMCLSLIDGSKCGYTILTHRQIDNPIGVGYVGTGDVWRDWGSPARIGNKIYAAFVHNDVTNGSEALLSCFDLDSGAQCPSPGANDFLVGTSTVQLGQTDYLQGPRVVAYGAKLYVTYPEASTGKFWISCWNTLSNAVCGDGLGVSWPHQLSTNSPFGVLPVLSSTGAIAAICSVIGATQQCFDPASGSTVSNGFPSQETATESAPAFFGQGRIFGTRVVFNSGLSDAVSRIDCVDFASSPPTNCTTLSLSNARITYSLDPDPQRQYCYWVNSDSGSKQIQNFDVRTMSLGCGSDLRISRAQVAPIVDGCTVYSWISMKVSTPSEWTSASVSVVGPNGAALPGGSSISLTDSNTATSFSGVDFSSATNFDFLLNFDAATLLADGITAQFTFETDPVSRCQTSKPVLFAVPSTVELPYGSSFTAPTISFYTDLAHTTPAEVTPSAILDCSAPAYTTTTVPATYAGYVTCVANTTATNTDPVYFIDTTAPGDLLVSRRLPLVTYTGSEGSIAQGSTLALASTVTPDSCTGGMSYYISPNPFTGTDSMTLTAPSSSTSGWSIDSYTVTAAYSGDTNCRSGVDTGTVAIGKRPSSVAYTGTTGNVALGTSLALSSVLTPAQCTGPVAYVITPNPNTGSDSLTASGTSPSTSGWTVGSYTITAAFAGDAACDPSSDSGTITLAKSQANVVYTGTTGSRSIGESVTLTSLLTPSQCTESRTYSISPDPTTGSGTLTLGASPVSTSTWLPGAYVITTTYAGSGDCNGASDTATLTMGKAASTVNYTGTAGSVAIGSSVTLSASVTPSFCTGTITYSISPDPLSSAASRVLSSSPVSTTGWPAGIYTISASYPGDSRCLSSDDVTTGVLTLTSGDPGNGTYGGGWYRTNGIRVNFGHVITSTSTTSKLTGNVTTTYKGQLLWMSRNAWRLKASMSSSLVKNSSGSVLSGSALWLKMGCPTSPVIGTSSSKPVCGQFSGTAVLQKWDWTANGGLGGWVTSSYGTVSFTMTVWDGGKLTTCSKNVCKTSELTDYVGLAINGLNPLDLVPVSSPIAVASPTGNGSVRSG